MYRQSPEVDVFVVLNDFLQSLVVSNGVRFQLDHQEFQLTASEVVSFGSYILFQKVDDFLSCNIFW